MQCKIRDNVILLTFYGRPGIGRVFQANIKIWADEADMAKLVTFSVNGERRPGALKGGRVLDLAAAGLATSEHGDLLAIEIGRAHV